MMARCWHMARRIRLLGKALLSVLMVCSLTDLACSQGKPAYDVAQRHLRLVPPGTIVGKEPPKGWTDLIIKSQPHPGAGDMKQLSATADRLARFLFTAILAEVQNQTVEGGRRCQLAKVAVGLGTRIGDKDVIITPETQRRLGADLGLLARVVLRTAQEKLADIMVVARSDTMILFDAPGLMVRDEKHKPVVLRYAVLVDERSGRVRTLLWVLDHEERGSYRGPAGPIQWLPPSKMEDCVLHVDANEFSLGQPTEKAFAMMAAPKGQKEIPVGDDLKPLVSRRRFSADMAAELESKLREALAKIADK